MLKERKKEITEKYISEIRELFLKKGTYFVRTQGTYKVEAKTLLFFIEKGEDAQGIHDFLETCGRTTRLYLSGLDLRLNSWPGDEELLKRINIALQ